MRHIMTYYDAPPVRIFYLQTLCFYFAYKTTYIGIGKAFGLSSNSLNKFFINNIINDMCLGVPESLGMVYAFQWISHC